jgi:hypothetical protein
MLAAKPMSRKFPRKTFEAAFFGSPVDHKLVTQGFKPKDAVELFLQDIALEYRNQPKVQAQAKTDAEDFLRRVRAGLI